MLLTNRGLIFGSQDRSDWRLMCNEALDINPSETPDLAVAEDGRIVVATSVGLQITAGEGCDWTKVDAFRDAATPALTQVPDEPNHLYVSTFGPGAGAIRVTNDGGKNFDVATALEENDYVSSLRVSPGSPSVLYASGLTIDDDGTYHHYIARSTTGGTSWTRLDLELWSTELEVRLLSVSPTTDQLVLAKTISLDPKSYEERLLVSHDGGTTFTSPLSVVELNGAAFSADGTKIWVAGKEGLWRSTDEGQSFTKVGPAEESSCVSTFDGALLACGFFSGATAAFGEGMNGVGISTDGGTTFLPWMTFGEVGSPVECDGSTHTAAVCAQQWIDWQSEITPTQPGAGGTGAGGANAGGTGVAGSGGEIDSVGGAAGSSGQPDGGAQTVFAGGADPTLRVPDGSKRTDSKSGCLYATRSRGSDGAYAFLIALLLGMVRAAKKSHSRTQYS